MKRLLFWLRVAVLAIPLGLIVAEYNATPKKAVIKSEIPTWAMGEASEKSLTVAEGKVMWDVVSKKMWELETLVRKKDAVGRIFENPMKAQTIMVCVISAWLLQIVSFAWEEKRKKNETIA